MNSTPSSPPQLPGSPRGSFRSFFQILGVGLILLVGFSYLRSPNFPQEILLLVAGIGAFLLLTGLLWPAPKPLTADEQHNRLLSTGETLLKSGPANQQRGWENRGGVLTLTSQRLVFLSHGLSVQNADLVIPLVSISRVERTRTLGIIPNAFRVIAADGSDSRFTVFTPRAWIEAINQARGVQSDASRSTDGE